MYLNKIWSQDPEGQKQRTVKKMKEFLLQICISYIKCSVQSASGLGPLFLKCTALMSLEFDSRSRARRSFQAL